LTLAPGSVINGTVGGGFGNVFQLGGSGSATFDVSAIGGQYQDFSTFNKIDSSSWTLSGSNTNPIIWTIEGGVLAVNGSMPASTMTVNDGGTLGGSGSVGGVNVGDGGVFAPGSLGVPGTPMTVGGTLAFQSGALYVVALNAATPTLASATAHFAELAGGVQAGFAPGSSISRQAFTILHADIFSGTTFDSVSVPGFAASLSYINQDVILNLNAATLGAGSALNRNQQQVASTLNNFFNSGGTLPPGFASVFALTGAPLGAALTQLSGETATGSQQTTFDAMSMFLGLMTDPSSATRGEPVTPTSPAQAYAEMPTKAFPRFASTYTPGWRVWSAGFGGSETTQGNSTIGSNDTTSRIFGGVAGADYHFSPDTLLGFALAGGGTNFSVANGGTGRSDLFQAGTYMRHSDGAAYVTAALAYGWQDIITNRSIGADQLRAEFNANAWSGRIEGGYRFSAFNGLGVTPYAAAQSTVFDLPAYAESTAGGGPFALSYDSKSVVDTRGELGFRTDKAFAVENAVLTLRGRAAWAHDFNTDRSVAATFQSLPGASFVVDGAAQAQNSALVSASAELAWHNGWSVAGTFDGEFSNVTQSYAAKGVVRYAW
jgi:uncharacterized protein with beta-barrel porin domain